MMVQVGWVLLILFVAYIMVPVWVTTIARAWFNEKQRHIQMVTAQEQERIRRSLEEQQQEIDRGIRFKN